MYGPLQAEDRLSYIISNYASAYIQFKRDIKFSYTHTDHSKALVNCVLCQTEADINLHQRLFIHPFNTVYLMELLFNLLLRLQYNEGRHTYITLYI
jgi:hypothetical protein